MNPIIKKILPHVVAIISFLVLCAIYFSPQLQGKTIRQFDNTQYRGMSEEIRQFKIETGETTLWTNSMFGGMPSYQINNSKEGNTIRVLDKIARLNISRPIGYFLAAMVSFYILMLVSGVNPWLSMVGAIAFGFTTNNLVLFEAGHNTKLLSIAYLPLIASGIILAFQRKYLWGGIVFAAGMGLNIYANHVQMTYILLLTLAILGIAQLIRDAKRGELPAFGKAVGVLLVGGLLALGSASVNLWTSYEYQRDTMRGEPILKNEGNAPNTGIQSSSETKGLSWDYAMTWSNGFTDLFSIFIPGVVGGGSQETAPASLKKDPQWRQIIQSQTGGKVPLYWGSLPSTSGPNYMGAIIVFLFLMGLTLVKGPVKWWLAIGVLLTMMLSMGKNLEILNRIVFDYLPFYNKFRSPNSVMSVTALLVPALGILAVSNIIKKKNTTTEIMRSLYIASGISAALCLFFALLGSSFYDFASPGDARIPAQILKPLVEARQSVMQMDALRSLVLVLLGAGLIWAFVKEKIKMPILLAALGILTLGDLWLVGKRYVTTDDFNISQSQAKVPFVMTDADKQILADKDPNYRVFDVTGSTFQDARASFFHKSIGGYHAAKLQRYADIIDRHLAKSNQEVINMLNTKYFIVQGQNNQPRVQRNQGALGNAWFVDSLIWVNTSNEEINALSDFKAAKDAVVNKEFESYLSGFNPTKNGTIQLADYQPNKLVYQTNATSEQLAVFSEIWYGPDKGWQAYVDDEAVEHIRVNYLLRAMKIPAGQHTIRFEFVPQTYYTGKTVSLVSSLLIVIGLFAFGGYKAYQTFTNLPKETPNKSNVPTEKNTQRTVAKRTSSKRRKK